MKTVECEIYVIVDSEGQCSASTDAEAVGNTHEEQHDSSLGGTDGFRLIKLVLTVPVPEAITVTGTVPEFNHGKLLLEVVEETP